MDSDRPRHRRPYVPAWQGLSLRMWLGSRKDRPLPFPLDQAEYQAFHTARSAIFHLFRTLVASGRTRVLAPDYHMGNELRAIRASGAQVELYRIDKEGRPDLTALTKACARGADILFTIHYAGWPQPVHRLRKICDEQETVLVEDCALAFLSDLDRRPLGSFGDYAVYCLYKSLPTLDGGILVQNRASAPHVNAMSLRRIGRAFEAGQAAELWLERFRSRAPGPGSLLQAGKRRVGAALTALRVERVPVGDIGFDESRTDIAMSSWSRRLLPRLDYAWIRQRRRDNFMLLRRQLAHVGIAPWRELEPGVCPLFFPLLVADKSSAARRLKDGGVMATELWNEGDPHVAHEEGEAARFLRRHLLELPIHQDLLDEHIHYIADQVAASGIALARPSLPARASATV